MNAENRVLMEKPDIVRLRKSFTVVDLHFHTAYTDGRNTVSEIVRRASDLGIGIAITDHNDIRGAVEINQYKQILSIPGIEVTSREGAHVLVYFYSIKGLKDFYAHDIRPFMGHDVMSSTAIGVEEILFRARKHQAVVIFPHPYCAAYTGICNTTFSKDRQLDLLRLADGVEVVNSENFMRWNLKSTVLGFNLNRAITGGSDGHSLEHMGGTVVYSDCQPTPEALLDAIKLKGCKVVGKDIHMLSKVASSGLKLRTNVRNYPDIMEKNIRYGRTFIYSKSRMLRDKVAQRLHGGRVRTKAPDR